MNKQEMLGLGADIGSVRTDVPQSPLCKMLEELPTFEELQNGLRQNNSEFSVRLYESIRSLDAAIHFLSEDAIEILTRKGYTVVQGGTVPVSMCTVTI